MSGPKGNERGLVISKPVSVVGSRLTTGGNLDPQELRYSLLFWDKLDFPDNNLISLGSDSTTQFLQKEEILKRTRIQLAGGDAAQMLLSAHLSAFRMLDKNEPGVWSLGSGINSVSFPERELETGRGISVRLYEAIPVPDKDVPLQDILEFRTKHRDELLALRHHLDAIYQRIIAAGDGALALNSELGALENAIEDYIKTAKEFRFPFVSMSFDANLNVPAAVLAAVATFNTVFGVISSLLAGAAAGLAMGPTTSLKNHKTSATPFRYISSFHKRVF
jgi:hypothetical protein